MHRIVPGFIVENYRAGRYQGGFQAASMFLDLSGFSTMTDTLMQHGQQGAEVLVELMRTVFDPLISSIYEQGGQVVGFAGDGVTAIFPVSTDMKSAACRALAAALRIRKRMSENPAQAIEYGTFHITAKIGLACGDVSWGILRSSEGDRATSYFRGPAINDSAEAEHHARPGDIILARNLFDLLQQEVQVEPHASLFRLVALKTDLPDPGEVTILPVDLSVSRLFVPESVIVEDLGGEFRQVVNLFLRFPDLPDDELESFMNTVFGLQQQFGGLLSRLDFGDKGSNLLMLWGAPIAYENDVSRALNFVFDLQSRVDFPITAGVTYYIAHAGYLGSSLCEDYTCYGWGVNLASRFMVAAPVGQIWVDDRVARRIKFFFELEYIGAQRFKGFATEQKVFLLRGQKAEIEPLYQGEMVGRAEELKRLEELVSPLWKGEYAGITMVWGDAGIGKGRLVFEFKASPLFDQHRCLWAICQADQVLRQPFNPVRYWLFRYFGLTSKMSQTEREGQFHARLDELIALTGDDELTGELDRMRSVIASLVNLHWPDSFFQQLDAQARYDNTLLAIIVLLKAESLRQPVIMFWEDAQFIDEDSKAFLPRLERALTLGKVSYPVAIIATSRLHGPALPFPDNIIDHSVNLHGLSVEDISRLDETLLGGPASPELDALIASRSEGNPFFAEQILHYMQEENLLEMSKKGWALVKTLNESVLPADISAVLIARLDQLAREVQVVVQTASVLGREFEVHVLAHMMGRDDSIYVEIQEAERAAIWTALSQIRYIFTHGLLRDAAYAMQMQAHRQSLHALAVEALESLYQDDLHHHYGELAYHAEHANLSGKARRYFILAAESAVALYHNMQAVEYYLRALTLMPEEDFRSRCNLLVEMIELCSKTGNREMQLADLILLDELSRLIDDRDLIAHAKMLYADYYLAVGDFHKTMDYSTEVVSTLLQPSNIETGVRIYPIYAAVLLRFGMLDEAMQQAKEGLYLAQRASRKFNEGKALNLMGLIALEQKDPKIALDYLRKALAIAREIQNSDLEGSSLNNLANSIGYVERDFALAREYYQQAHAIFRLRGERPGEALALSNLGWVSTMLGDFAAARSYCEQALVTAREVAHAYTEEYALINLSAAVGFAGDKEGAKEYARQALELAIRIEDKAGIAWCLLYSGNAHLELKEFSDAIDKYQRARLIRQELGQIALEAEPVAGLILATLETGDHAAALRETEWLLAHLKEGGTLDAAEEPLRVYYACHKALKEMRDPRANIILADASRLLDAQVSKLHDDEARRMYIENVPWRRAIQEQRSRF